MFEAFKFANGSKVGATVGRLTMAFQAKIKRVQQQFPSPEEPYLSGTLPRTTEAVDGLWVQQGDVIRAHAENHQGTPDLALELPTGSGKTIPGLLIADWVRRKGEGPVIYATPTKQLARQVHATARREGVPSHLLIGTAENWDIAWESAVEGAEAIGITTPPRRDIEAENIHVDHSRIR